MTEKFYSSLITPRREQNRFGSGKALSMRAYAMNNRARNNYTNDTPTSKSFGGPPIPTESGSATDDGSLFGPAVPRKLNFNPGEIQRSGGPRKVFRHDDAIYIRYVDPSVTPTKMAAILNKNDKIKEAIVINPEVIEITRLVKKRCTEAEISQRRFGVSYRIGCAPELLALVNDLVNDKSIWANHWEIRSWDTNYGNNERHKQRDQRDSNANFPSETNGTQPTGT